jgi:tricorn protease
MHLEPNDLITASDFKPLAATPTLEEALLDRVGKETIVTIRRGAGAESREINLLITPITYERWTELSYKQWTLNSVKLVDGWSAGRLGYIHLRGMDQNSLDAFERDLYAAAHGRKGLIIDVRNNGGGWTTDRLLASIMAPDHAYTLPRGLEGKNTKGYPNDRLFIARYTLPINMLCNERSFSNAEIISHAFKTLKRGTLVGNTTAGGVISTGSAALLDGTTVRVPFRGWFRPDGMPMENGGAVPDLRVEQTPEDEAHLVDAQLKAAVEDLLRRAGK